MKIERRIYRPGPVTRPDAGGRLWAPVDQHNREQGLTPSYDAAAIGRFCAQLNAASERTGAEAGREPDGAGSASAV